MLEKIFKQIIGAPKASIDLLYNSTCDICKKWYDIENPKVFGVTSVVAGIILYLMGIVISIALMFVLDFSFLTILYMLIIFFGDIYFLPFIVAYALCTFGILILFLLSLLFNLPNHIPSEKFKKSYKKVYPYLSFYSTGVLILALCVLGVGALLSGI